MKKRFKQEKETAAPRRGNGFLSLSYVGRGLVVLLVLPGVVGVAGAVVVVALIGIRIGNNTIVATVHAEVCQNGLHLHAEHVGARLNIFFLDHSLFVFLWITILSSSSLTLDKA